LTPIRAPQKECQRIREINFAQAFAGWAVDSFWKRTGERSSLVNNKEGMGCALEQPKEEK
jgi:hypothetical protein